MSKIGEHLVEREDHGDLWYLELDQDNNYIDETEAWIKEYVENEHIGPTEGAIPEGSSELPSGGDD